MDTLKKRRFEYIDEDTYELLDESMKKRLIDYRQQYRICRLKEKRINTLKSKLKEQQDLVRVMKRDLTELSNPLEHLKNDFQFFTSVTRYKKDNHYYYNLCISKVQKNNSKSIGLGREKTIVKQLLECYKGNRKFISEIKKDWKLFVKDETNYGDVSKRIMKTIVKNPLGFKTTKITRDMLFPI